MKRKIFTVLAALLAFTLSTVPFKAASITPEKQSAGMNRDFWNIEFETDTDIILASYKGNATDIVIPGELSGKQVWIKTKNHKRTRLPSNITSLKFQEVNGKKVKVFGNSLQKCFSNYFLLTSFDGSGLDTTGMVSMYDLFYSCYRLKTITGLDNWDTSTVTEMDWMFSYCTELNSLIGSGIENWDTSKVTTMEGMFERCSVLKDVAPLEGWETSSVTTMQEMFYRCNSLETIDGLKNWNTSNVTTMKKMFFQCRSLIDTAALENWDTSNVTTMKKMFFECYTIKNIEGLKNWKTSNLTTIYNMFSECDLLKDISALENWDTSKIKNIGGLFLDCSSLVDITPLKNWNTSNVSDMSSLFTGCLSLADISPIKNWNTSSVTDMFAMLGKVPLLKCIEPIRNWDTSNVTDMGYMFFECSSLEDITPIEFWNTSNLMYMYHMFQDCSSLEDITPIKNWNTSNVVTVSHIFENCGKLKFVDLSNWDLSSCCGGWNMSNMFSTTDSAPLLIISPDNKLKNDYSVSNRTPIGPTFDANGGMFSDNSTTKKGNTTYILENETTALDEFVIGAVEHPTRKGYIFWGWDSTLDMNANAYDKLSDTFVAKWE